MLQIFKKWCANLQLENFQTQYAKWSKRPSNVSTPEIVENMGWPTNLSQKSCQDTCNIQKMCWLLSHMNCLVCRTYHQKWHQVDTSKPILQQSTDQFGEWFVTAETRLQCYDPESKTVVSVVVRLWFFTSKEIEHQKVNNFWGSSRHADDYLQKDQRVKCTIIL